MMTPYSRVAFILALVAAAAGSGLTSADSMHVHCEPDRYYDPVAQECTPCTDICDPARGTEYLCQKHIDVCNATFQQYKLQPSSPESTAEPYLDDVTMTSLTVAAVLLTCACIGLSVFICARYRTRICTTGADGRKLIREVKPVCATGGDVESILCVSSAPLQRLQQQQQQQRESAGLTAIDGDDDNVSRKLLVGLSRDR